MPIEQENYDPAIKYGASHNINIDLGDLVDVNNNELLEYDAVDSAVNYIRIANSATGNAPEYSAQGDDTNVALQLSAKGTAIVVIGDIATADEVSGSATINAQRGKLSTELATASGGTTFIDLINNRIELGSIINYGLSEINGNGSAVIVSVTPGSGSATIIIANRTSGGLSGSATINFIVL